MAEFVRPDWLGATPLRNYMSYGDPSGHVWYGCPGALPYQSLYDTHVDALKGDPRALETMRRYYLALTTTRLKA